MYVTIAFCCSKTAINDYKNSSVIEKEWWIGGHTDLSHSFIHVRSLTTPPKKAICPIAISDWVSFLKQP